MAGEGGGAETSLEFTPTWILALACAGIVAVSLAAERVLNYTAKFLKREKQWPLSEALLKIKEELMLLGFISLLLTVFQDRISRICIANHLTNKWLPCQKETDGGGGGRRLLVAAADGLGHCEKEGKAPLLSLEALHDLHLLIFLLAVVHFVFSALTIVFGSLKIRQWKQWEDSIHKREEDLEEGIENNVTHIHQHDFMRSRFKGFGKDSALLSWVHCFWKQFNGSVNESDYFILRRDFINNNNKDNPEFNFYEHMVHALETDLKNVVGVSWYLWIFVVLFVLLNVHGWHACFWIAFVPLILLLLLGTKLEHLITQRRIKLEHIVAELTGGVPRRRRVVSVRGDFWFSKPRFVHILIHIILFQNSFEIAYFIWVLVLFHFNSCIMGQVGYTIPRLVIGVLVQFLCSYSTLPLYAIVAQMGSSDKEDIFEEHIQAKLTEWAQKAKMKMRHRKAAGSSPSQVGNTESTSLITSEAPLGQESTIDEGKSIEIKTTSV